MYIVLGTEPFRLKMCHTSRVKLQDSDSTLWFPDGRSYSKTTKRTHILSLSNRPEDIIKTTLLQTESRHLPHARTTEHFELVLLQRANVRHLEQIPQLQSNSYQPSNKSQTFILFSPFHPHEIRRPEVVEDANKLLLNRAQPRGVASRLRPLFRRDSLIKKMTTVTTLPKSNRRRHLRVAPIYYLQCHNYPKVF